MGERERDRDLKPRAADLANPGHQTHRHNHTVAARNKHTKPAGLTATPPHPHRAIGCLTGWLGTRGTATLGGHKYLRFDTRVDEGVLYILIVKNEGKDYKCP